MSRGKIWALRKIGLPSVDVGGKLLYRPHAVLEWLEAGNARAEAEASAAE